MAILCNHQRSVPKGHAGQMVKLTEKMEKMTSELVDLERELEAAKKGKTHTASKVQNPDRCGASSITLIRGDSGLHVQQDRLQCVLCSPTLRVAWPAWQQDAQGWHSARLESTISSECSCKAGSCKLKGSPCRAVSKS